MTMAPEPPAIDRRRAAGLSFGRAWMGLAGALALHVTDEALTDFLAVYNPAVLAIRERFPWLPLPTFSFREWIGGLAVAIALLFVLSPLAFRGVRWLVVLAMPFSALMMANGLKVGAGALSLTLGVYSSPVLIAAAVLALVRAWRLARVLRAKA